MTHTGENVDVDESELTITMDDADHVIAWRHDVSMLTAMRDAGLSAPSSCEAGQCGTCLAMLKTGDAKMLITTALSDADIAEGLILSCQARPLSDRIHVDFDDI